MKRARIAGWVARAKLCAALCLAAGIGIAVGCSDDARQPGANLGGDPDASIVGCESGQTRDCGITLGEHNGVLTCFEGTQTCDDGVWSACGDGKISHRKGLGFERGPGELPPVTTKSLSMPVACVSNPCDPFCSNYDEQPDAPYVAEGGTPFNWNGGTVQGLPGSQTGRAFNQPCKTGQDCQMNTYCDNVATSGTCSHSKCSTGSALLSNCDPCVQAICAQDGSCCQGPCRTGEVYGPNGTCYFVGTGSENWTNARVLCQARGVGWDLASVTSSTENSFVQGLTTGQRWLGLNDFGTEGTFVWSNGDAASYFAWDPIATQPNGGAAQQCVEMETSGLWHDKACNDGYKYICEGSAAQPTQCAHEPCTTGAALNSTCDSCVAQICAAQPSCCSTTWDSTCTAMVVSTCGRTCPCPADSVQNGSSCYYFDTTLRTWSDAQTNCRARGTGWDMTSVTTSGEASWLESRISSYNWIGLNDVATEGTYVWSNGEPTGTILWSAGEPNNSGGNEDCVEIYNGTGAFNDQGCGSTRRSICERAALNPKSWAQKCVDMVASVCDAKCGSATDGTCQPWFAGQTDAACTGIDLAVGVPCDDLIPVCNHGTMDAPAGVDLYIYPDLSGEYPLQRPNLAAAGVSVCTTTQIVPAGKCISQQCSGLTVNKEVMVNPANGPNLVAECSYMDNWGLFTPGSSCQAPACSGATSQANVKPVNMYFTVDRSGSMLGTKWDGTIAALQAFFQSSGSAGVNVALEYFGLPATAPFGDGCANGVCTNAPCANPFVPLGALSAAAAPADAQEQALVAALTATTPSGGTPTYPALAGALDWGIARSATNPNELHVVILVTDGDPQACNTDKTQIAALAQNAFNTNGVLTYTIGMTGADIAFLDDIANKGGTNNAFVISGSNTAQVAANLLTALQSIANKSVSCTFNLPNAALLDPYNAVTTYNPSAGAPQVLPQVTDAAACGNGWYFDDNLNPTTLTLCPSTCSTVQGDPTASIVIEVPCEPSFLPAYYSEIYQPACPAGSQVQWGFLSYDSVAIQDSNIVFNARTADSVANLGSATTMPLATASVASTTGLVCPFSGPAPCPVDLYTALGGKPAAIQPVLELMWTITPNSFLNYTPRLNNWQITYSCPPAE